MPASGPFSSLGSQHPVSVRSRARGKAHFALVTMSLRHFAKTGKVKTSTKNMSMERQIDQMAVNIERKGKRVAAFVDHTVATMIADEAWQRAPVDTGNLRDSVFMEDTTTGDYFSGYDEAPEKWRLTAHEIQQRPVPKTQTRHEVIVGFTAEYAEEVHEDLETRHEHGEAKFLENAVDAVITGAGLDSAVDSVIKQWDKF